MITTLTPTPETPSEPTDPATPVESHDQAVPGREYDWCEPSLADRDKRAVVKAVIIAVLLVFGALVDAGLMRPAIMRVLRDTPTMAGVIAVALALVAAASAAMAGAAWRGARGNHPGRFTALILPGLIVLFWAGLGLGICWLRVGAAGVTTVAQYDGGQAAATGSGSASDTIAAAVFLLVYALVGILAFADAFEWRNDAFTAKVHAQKQLGPAQEHLAVSEALLVRLVENYSIREHELAMNRQEAANAKLANGFLAEELEQVSRVEQMIGQGDTGKSGITSGHHADNPYPARA